MINWHDASVELPSEAGHYIIIWYTVGFNYAKKAIAYYSSVDYDWLWSASVVFNEGFGRTVVLYWAEIDNLPSHEDIQQKMENFDK